ncbi:hypothetical protein HanIR_Chr01g0037921 [Helianthus annuus]|nr:hypothetical protein HanIR_Chr01g0037921 [Helianthus annuus]
MGVFVVNVYDLFLSFRRQIYICSDALNMLDMHGKALIDDQNVLNMHGKALIDDRMCRKCMEMH